MTRSSRDRSRRIRRKYVRLGTTWKWKRMINHPWSPRLASLLRPRLRGMCLCNHKKLMMKMMRLLEHTVGYVHETTMVIITVHDYFFGRSCAIMRSISETAGPDAFVLSTSRVLTSLALRASSPAFTISPHFTHISIRSSTGRCVHFGIKVDASLVFPAPRISL